MHRDGGRPVELDDRRGLHRQQRGIQRADLPPVGRLRRGRLGVDRGDGGLQRIGPEASRGQRALNQRDALADERVVPRRPILLLEQHERAIGADARRAPRLVQ